MMKTIIRKELRQGRPLLLFSVVLAGLLYLAHALFAAKGLGSLWFQGTRFPLDLTLGLAAALSPVLFALFAGVGLVASEAEHDTLPVLFGLPLSRRRLWTAKALSGAVLMVAASAVVLLVGRLLMAPTAFPFVGLTPWLDVALLGLFVLSAGLFVSVLTPHVIGAALAAAVLVIGLGMGTIAFMKQLGAPLLGYDGLLDMELWLALTAPTLLFVSARALARGELLQWRRSVLSHLLLVVVGLAVTAGVVVLLGRGLTGYDRGSVREVATAPTAPAASAVAVLSYSRPVPYQRGMVYERVGTEGRERGTGWMARPQDQPAASGSYDHGPLYRNHSAVVVDLKSGKELAVVRDSRYHYELTAAVSPDGGYAAIATAPLGLTWGGLLPDAPCHLTIVDLKTGRRSAAVLPARLREDETIGVAHLAWSPSGKHLAFNTAVSGSGGVTGDLYVMARDGGPAKLLGGRTSEGWAWHPRDDALLVADGSRLLRLSPDGGSSVLWQPSTAGGAIPFDPAGFSPNLQWLAVSRSRTAPLPRAGGAVVAGPRQTNATTLLVLPAAGGAARTLWQGEGGWRFSYAWKGDTLFVLATAVEVSPKHPVTTARLLRWRPGEAKATEIAASLPYPNGTLTSVRGEAVLLWPQRQYRKEQYQIEDTPLPFTVGVMSVQEDGSRRRLPGTTSSLSFVEENRFVTVAADGRLITAQGAPVARRLAATEVRTGAGTPIYP